MIKKKISIGKKLILWGKSQNRQNSGEMMKERHKNNLSKKEDITDTTETDGITYFKTISKKNPKQTIYHG